MEALIDFRDSRRDRDGSVFHHYEYVFGSWEKHVIDLPRRGVLLQAPNGKGGLGENKTDADFRKCTAVRVHYIIGNANKAKSLSFMLQDGDGTECTWPLLLDGQSPGQEYGQRVDLTRPAQENAPGKKPGLDLKRIYKWELKGDWAEPNVEVLVIALVPEPAASTPAPVPKS